MRSESLTIDMTRPTDGMSADETVRYYRELRMAEHIVNRLEQEDEEALGTGEADVSTN